MSRQSTLKPAKGGRLTAIAKDSTIKQKPSETGFTENKKTAQPGAKPAKEKICLLPALIAKKTTK